MDYIIYHQVKPGTDCPDGLAAAWVASKAHPEAKVIGCCYGSVPEVEFNSGDSVFIVDFSFPAAQLEAWADAGIKVVVIDHHKTALENLQALSDRILQRFDMAECGATLAWQYFFPAQPIPVFLIYIKDRDLWHKSLESCNEVHEAMAALGRNFGLFDTLAPMSREELLAYLVPVGAPLLEEKRRKIEAIAARHELSEFVAPDGSVYRIALVRLALDASEDRFTSDVCEVLYRSLGIDFAACITSTGEYSLRSGKGGADVSAIARQYGGGGHYHAAGFKPQTVHP